ncbi:TyeA family type III secretion system gatekeeper subunit [Paraburkholderia sediminicola]|uniref:TyeA family type III secretion system gatekeeper subunit n=1 Tax=Paraburkholderia sediminicola TaxID=458836 RepID=UPI0038BCB4EA
MIINGIPGAGQMPGLSPSSSGPISSASGKGGPKFLTQLVNEEIAAQRIWATASDVDEVASLLGELGAIRKSGSKEAHALGRKAIVRAALAQAGADDGIADMVEGLAQCNSEADLQQLLGGADAATQLLALGDALEKSSLSDETRALLEQSLKEGLEQPGWAVNFFSAVEFRALAGMAMADISALYEHAAGGSPSLIEWFRQLRRMQDRKRKLKVMIHAMGAELTEVGRADERERLSAVLGTLKRMLVFLGIEQYCETVAERTDIDGLDGDTLLDIILGMLEEDWLYEELISDRYQEFQLNLAQCIRYIRALRSVLALLPELCFRDDEQRANVTESINTCEDQLVQTELRG